jgi:hypothetical protein
MRVWAPTPANESSLRFCCICSFRSATIKLRHDGVSILIGNTSVSPSIRQKSRRAISPIMVSALSRVDKGKCALLGVECDEGMLEEERKGGKNQKLPDDHN